MSKMNKAEYIMCLEDTLPYITKEQFYAAMSDQTTEALDKLLTQPLKSLSVSTMTNIWSKIKNIEIQ